MRRLVLISCVDSRGPFEATPGGTLTRLLLAAMLKKFRTAIIVVASSTWCAWWKEVLQKKNREVVELLVGQSQDERALASGDEIVALATEEERAAALLKWYKCVVGVEEDVDDDEEEEKEEERNKDKEEPVAKKKKVTLVDFFHSVCGPLYPVAVSTESLLGVEDRREAIMMSEGEKDRLKKPMAWTFPAIVGKSVSVYGKGGGVVVSDIGVDAYERKLDEFLRETGLFFNVALDSIAKCKSFDDICRSLTSLCPTMPFTLARVPVNLASDFVHLFLGQDYKDGWTFANQVVGSAVPVRFVHRKAGLNDLQFATYDVLPCNHDWKHDLDFFVSCSECRSRVKIDNSAKHITPGLPVEPKGCGECKRRWVRVMDWLCVQLAAMLQVVTLSGAQVFVTPGGQIARAVFNRLCRNATKWVSRLKLKMPSGDVCHPNAVSFATTMGQLSKCRADYGRLVVDLRNFRTETKSRRWEGGIKQFYSELQAVYRPFDPAVVSEERMAVVAALRKVVVSVVEVAIKKLNRLIGSEEELAPINLGVRVNRLICQIHLQRLATGEDLGQKISALVAVKDSKPPAAVGIELAAAASEHLTRGAKRSFFERCY